MVVTAIRIEKKCQQSKETSSSFIVTGPKMSWETQKTFFFWWWKPHWDCWLTHTCEGGYLENPWLKLWNIMMLHFAWFWHKVQITCDWQNSPRECAPTENLDWTLLSLFCSHLCDNVGITSETVLALWKFVALKCTGCGHTQWNMCHKLPEECLPTPVAHFLKTCFGPLFNPNLCGDVGIAHKFVIGTALQEDGLKICTLDVSWCHHVQDHGNLCKMQTKFLKEFFQLKPKIFGRIHLSCCSTSAKWNWGRLLVNSTTDILSFHNATICSILSRHALQITTHEVSDKVSFIVFAWPTLMQKLESFLHNLWLTLCDFMLFWHVPDFGSQWKLLMMKNLWRECTTIKTSHSFENEIFVNPHLCENKKGCLCNLQLETLEISCWCHLCENVDALVWLGAVSIFRLWRQHCFWLVVPRPRGFDEKGQGVRGGTACLCCVSVHCDRVRPNHVSHTSASTTGEARPRSRVAKGSSILPNVIWQLDHLKHAFQHEFSSPQAISTTTTT